MFSPQEGRNVMLAGVEDSEELAFLPYERENSKTAWSKARNEVYYHWDNEVWIWNWDSGKLKKRVRYMKTGTPETTATVSPDGKWILAYEQLPDRQCIWFAHESRIERNLDVIRTADSKYL
jgi:hypothetical protein